MRLDLLSAGQTARRRAKIEARSGSRSVWLMVCFEGGRAFSELDGMPDGMSEFLFDRKLVD